MNYRPDIDGLRALAVLPVVTYHAGLSFTPGGFVGVDVFFVISGYLITKHIQEDLSAGTFSILNFYDRRIRRILPALVFTMALCTAAAFVLLLPVAMEDFSRSLIAASTFVSNFYFWSNSSYFDASAQTRPLLHTWSLAVEEQFYLVIPVIMFIAFRCFWNYTVWMFAAGIVVSLGLSVALSEVAPSANFYLLPSRAWELLLGSVLALAPLKPIGNRALREGTAAAGVALILFGVLTYSHATPFPGLAAIPPTLGAFLIIYTGLGHRTYTSALLSTRPLVAIGLVSYSFYLLHWPVIVFAKHYTLKELDLFGAIVCIVVSGGLAAFSWWYVERPFRRKGTFSQRTILLGAGSALAVVSAVGLAGVASEGFHGRFPDLKIPTEVATKYNDWKANDCFLSQRQGYEDWKGDDCVRTEGAKDNALLWGDSFAAHYVSGLLQNTKGLQANIVQYTFAGCAPILSYRSYAIPGCHTFNAHVFDVIERYQTKTVVIVARWDLLQHRGFGGLRETILKLKQAGVKDVYVIGQSPSFAVDVFVLAYRRAGFTRDGSSASWPISFDPSSNRQIAKYVEGSTFIDPLSHLCKGVTCLYSRNGELLFSDFGHLSDAGSDLAVRSYFPLYRREPKSKQD